MRKILLAFLVAGSLISFKGKKEAPAKQKTFFKAADTTAPAEFADPKYMQWGKQRQQQFENGDVDGWIEQFADNAVYIWSAGDSLAGKKAILDYWKNRRKNSIRSIKFSNDIWLPIKINQPQKGPDLPGVWLLSWYQVNVTYNTGKSLNFWVHADLHYDTNDKVDRVVQYIDRAPINAATNQK